MPKDNEGEEFQVKITTIYGPNSGHQNTFLGKKKKTNPTITTFFGT